MTQKNLFFRIAHRNRFKSSALHKKCEPVFLAGIRAEEQFPNPFSEALESNSNGLLSGLFYHRCGGSTRFDAVLRYRTSFPFNCMSMRQQAPENVYSTGEFSGVKRQIGKLEVLEGMRCLKSARLGR